MRSAAKRITLEGVGWVLLVAGIAALILPGPGLLMLFGGVAILSQQYDWARRWMAPLKKKAMKGAADSVETWPRIVISTVIAVGLIACGVLWILSPPAPEWWPLADRWWLPGGLATGITQVASGIIALALLAWSYRKFRGHPEAVAAVDEMVA